MIELVLCVVDLVPKENVEKWIELLQKEFPVVAFKASTQIQDRTVVGAFINVPVLNTTLKKKWVFAVFFIFEVCQIYLVDNFWI